MKQIWAIHQANSKTTKRFLSFRLPFGVTIDAETGNAATVSAEAQLLRRGPLCSPCVSANCLCINSVLRCHTQGTGV